MYVVFNLCLRVVVYIARVVVSLFFFQAEDGIRDLVRSRGLGDVYKRQNSWFSPENHRSMGFMAARKKPGIEHRERWDNRRDCLLYTSDAADERSSVDLGGRRIIKKKKNAARSLHTKQIQETTHTEETRSN